VSRWDLKYNNTRDKAMNELMLAQSQMLSEKNKIVYGEPMSVEAIRQAILTERLRTGPIDLVVVDHAQVAEPNKEDKKSMPRYLQVKSTAEGLRALARQLKVAIVLTAQMNPVPKGDTPTMSMVRESKDINNTAEVVIMIYHEKGDGFGGEIIITKSWLVLEKVRAGREGKIEIKYFGHLFKFGEVRREE
jgi:replicative DNA helicase